MQVSSSRTEIINSAIEIALEQRKNEGLRWNKVLSGDVPLMYDESVDFPEFIQLRVDADKYSDIAEQMKEDFELQKHSPVPFVVKLLLVNYWTHLENKIAEKESSGVYDTTDENGIKSQKQKKLAAFKSLSFTEEKLAAIYELLLEIGGYE